MRGDLARPRLRVEAALAREHDVGVRDEPGQSDRVGPAGGSGSHDRAPRDEAGRGAARRARTRGGRIHLEQAGEVGEARAESAHVRGRRALLRAVDGGGAGGPGEGSGDVAEDQRSARRERPEPGEVDRRDVRERDAAVAHRGSVRAEGPRPELAERAHAAVRGRAAAEREEQARDAGVERRPDRAAEAAGVGGERSERIQQRDAARRRDLDHARAVGQQEPARVDGPVVGSGDADGHAARSRDGGREHVDGALSAVGHGRDHHVVAGSCAEPAAAEGLGGLDGGGGSGERVGGHDDAQRAGSGGAHDASLPDVVGPRSGPARPRPRRTRSDAAAPDQSGATPARCASSAAPTSPASLPRLAAMISVSRCRNAEKRANSCAAAPPTTMRSGDMIDSRCR